MRTRKRNIESENSAEALKKKKKVVVSDSSDEYIESESETVEKPKRRNPTFDYVEKEIKKLSSELKEKYKSVTGGSSKKSYTLKDILETDTDDASIQVALKLYNRKLEIVNHRGNRDDDLDFDEGEPTTPEGYDLLIHEILKLTPMKIKCKKMRETVKNLDTTYEIKQILLMKIDQYASAEETNENSTNESYLNLALALPYNKKKSILDFGASKSEFLAKVKSHLDANLFGMEKAKEQLLIALNNKITNPEASFSLGFKGPPGVGKTKVASVFAEAIGFPIEKIPLGGLQDPTLLRGGQKSWVGSSAGMILQIMAKMKVSNGIILFDEIDKLNSDKGIEVQNALLHVTDYSSNNEFSDSFISDFNHDISNLMFFYSLNDESHVNPILLDRLTIIDIEPYTHEQLAHIGLHYTLRKERIKLGLASSDFDFTVDNMKYIVNKLHPNVKRAGVRKLEQAIKYICSCLNFMKNSNLQLTFVPPPEIKDKNKILEHMLDTGGFIKKQDESYLNIYM